MLFSSFFRAFSSTFRYLHGGDDGLLGPLHRNLPGAKSQAWHSGSIVQLKVRLLLHKRTTFVRSIKECTVYNEHEAQARHSGSIVQLKVGLLLHRRTKFIKRMYSI